MSCTDCESCRDCTFAFLQQFLEALVGMSVAFLQFSASLSGIALGTFVLAVAAFWLFHN